MERRGYGRLYSWQFFISLADYLIILPLEQFPPLLPNQWHLLVTVRNVLPDLPLNDIALKLRSDDEVFHQLDATTDAQRKI